MHEYMDGKSAHRRTAKGGVCRVSAHAPSGDSDEVHNIIIIIIICYCYVE